jgi:hypothetical protein
MLTMRHVCDARRRRGTAPDISEDILREFAKHVVIDLAYPTPRFYDNVREGKRTLRLREGPSSEPCLGGCPAVFWTIRRASNECPGRALWLRLTDHTTSPSARGWPAVPVPCAVGDSGFRSAASSCEGRRRRCGFVQPASRVVFAERDRRGRRCRWRRSQVRPEARAVAGFAVPETPISAAASGAR